MNLLLSVTFFKTNAIKSAADPVPLRTTTGVSCWIFWYKRTKAHTIGKPCSLHGVGLLGAAGSVSKRNQWSVCLIKTNLIPVVPACVPAEDVVCGCGVSWCKKASKWSRNLFVALSTESVNFSKIFSVFSFFIGFFSEVFVGL